VNALIADKQRLQSQLAAQLGQSKKLVDELEGLKQSFVQQV